MIRNRPALFRGRHFEAEIIVLCVRWYLRFGLSFRNLEELMAERNLSVDHVTIWRWVQRYAPELHRRCRSELRMTNRSWRVDETYFRIAGKWTYLYRAVDSSGDTIDFLLSPKRDADAAKRFFPASIAVTKPSSATSDQRGQESRLAKRYRRTQADSRTRSTLPLSARSLSEQCRVTRSSRNQASGKSDAGIPAVSLRVANHSGHREHKHDS